MSRCTQTTRKGLLVFFLSNHHCHSPPPWADPFCSSKIGTLLYSYCCNIRGKQKREERYGFLLHGERFPKALYFLSKHVTDLKTERKGAHQGDSSAWKGSTVHKKNKLSEIKFYYILVIWSFFPPPAIHGNWTQALTPARQALYSLSHKTPSSFGHFKSKKFLVETIKALAAMVNYGVNPCWLQFTTRD